MSANQDDIRVRIAGDIADIRKALADLRKDTRAAGGEAKKSQSDWKGLENSLDGIKRRVVGIVSAYLGFRAIGGLIRSVVRHTVEAEQVSAQLEARVKSTGQAAGFTTEQLLAMASEFQQVTAFGDEAVASMQSVLLTFTRISGDEFTDATEAILNMATALDKDLTSAALQVGKALNDPIKGVAALAESGIQFSGEQRELIQSLTETGDIAGAQRVILAELETQFGGAARAARDTLGGAIGSLKNAFGDLLEGEGGTVDGAREAIEELVLLLQDPATKEAFQTLIGAIATLTTLAGEAVVQFTDLGQRIGFTAALITGNVSELDKLQEKLEDVNKELAARAEGSFLQRMPIFLGKSREELEAMRIELERAIEVANAAAGLSGTPPATGSGGGRVKAPDPLEPIDARPALQRLQADLEAAGVVLTDELKRLREQLDRDFAQNLVSFEDYYQRRAALEQSAVDSQLQQRRTALDLIDEEIRLLTLRGEETAEQENKRLKLLAEITVLEQQRADDAGESARLTAEAESDLAAQLEKVRDRLLELQGNTAEARARELEREFSALRERLLVEGDAEGAALVDALINVETARANLDTIEADYQAALERMARAERRIELQAQTGVITEFEARQKIAELHRETAAEIEKLIPLMQSLAEASGDPAAVARLEELQLELDELAATAETAMKEISDSVRDAGSDAFASWLSGVQDARGAFKSFMDDVRRRLSQMLSDRLFDQLFSNLGGKGGGKGGGAGGFFASLFHDGGLVGEGGRMRRVPAIAFAGAPRLHSGGIPGLLPDERAAILQTGEEVLSRRDPRNRLNGGGGITINVSTPDAETVVRRNPGALAASMSSAMQLAANRNN